MLKHKAKTVPARRDEDLGGRPKTGVIRNPDGALHIVRSPSPSERTTMNPAKTPSTARLYAASAEQRQAGPPLLCPPEAPFDWHRPREHVRIINESPGNHICLEMIPHPRCRGDWFLKPSWGAPSGLWYRERQFAVSYAEWLAREAERAEIRVYNQDGSLSESRVVGRAAQLGEYNWAINSSANRELPGVGPLQHAYIECLGRASGRARNSRQARCVGTGEAASG